MGFLGKDKKLVMQIKSEEISLFKEIACKKHCEEVEEIMIFIRNMDRLISGADCFS